MVSRLMGDSTALASAIVRCCLLSFALFCLTFASQKSFHLSLMPRRAPHFLFGKKMGEKNREGRCPFEPHSCALRPIFSSSALLAGLTALRAAIRRLTGKRSKKPRSRAQLFQAFLCEGGRLRPFADHPLFLAAGRLSGHSAANRRQIRETLEKPRSEAQLFKRFCAKGDACALSLISPFFWLLAGLTALRAANRRLTWETPEKPKEQSSAFRAFLCVGVRLASRFSHL